MPFDALTMAAARDDLAAAAEGGQIQKILQPAPLAVGLSVYRDGRRRWILLSADARAGRVAIVEDTLAKAFATPSPFIMLLRKHLEGKRIISLEQMPYERVLTFTTGAEPDAARLVVEIMGKHSNIILVGQGERILGAIKVVRPSESRVRPVTPGRLYVPPPAQPRDPVFPPGPRLDPAACPSEVAESLAALPPSIPARQALLGLLAGCSPFLADDLLSSVATPAAQIGEAPLGDLVTAARIRYSLWRSREWQPVTFLNARGKPDFAPFVPAVAADISEWPTISEAMEAAVAGTESHDALGTLRGEVTGEIEKALIQAQRRAASLAAGLEAAAAAEDVMARGQLVLAYLHAIPAGAASLDLPDLGITIPLDPALTAQQNSERLFRRYRKLRDARARLPAMVADAEKEIARLADLKAFVPLAISEADLRAIQRDLKPATPPSGKAAAKKQPKRGPARYRHGSVTALAGRSARENEEVTFRLAGRDDLWLHARERTGAHVIIPGTAAEEDVLSAAQLAAHLSEARADTRVDVDVARVRDVRKIPGAAPGRVTYRAVRTVRVAPATDGWDRI
ncbi:MAG TPA: NFACT family protein [Chloroflexota bacterium]|nr:NFACT family protein [Chloroflexota bacterium]